MFERVILTSVLFMLLSFSSAAQQLAPNNSPLSFGTPQGIVRIEVFYDLECASCAPFHERLKKAVDRFPGKVFVTIRHFPLPMHDNAFLASSIIEAARKQEKGLDMIDLLLSDQQRWAWKKKVFGIFLKYAEQLDLEVGTFRTDVFSNEVTLSLVQDMDLGRRRGVNSTPFMYLNGKAVDFVETYEIEKLIQKVIDSEVIKIG